jgi:cell wall-associated NlpC family hydrolase
MEKRNFMISIAVLASGLAACSSAPPRLTGEVRAPSPLPNNTPPNQPPPGESPGPDAIARLLATDRDPRRTEIALAALSQVGSPYAWGGHSPTTGFDCSGLVAYVYRRTSKLVLPRVASAQARSAAPVDLDDLRAADLVFYNTLGEEFSHVGIYIGQERFVHAPATGSWVQIARVSAPYWRSRFSGARRVIA